MIGFLARTAIRTTARAATHAYLENQRNQKAYAAAAAAAATPFAIVPDATGESSLFIDKRIGFSHALPGYPRPLAVWQAPNEPQCDALIGLGEAPIGVRYRVEPPMVHAADATDLAVKQGDMYLAWRFGGASSVAASVVNQAQCSASRVEGASTAEYALPAADAFGATHEEFFLLVRQGMTLLVTFRYPGNDIDPMVLATFRSVARASLVWDPAYPPTPPALWPPSSFVGPGLASPLLPYRESQVPYLTTPMNVALAERDPVGRVIESLATGPEPPWHPLSHADVASASERLVAAAPSSPEFARMVQTVIAEVRSWRDLRGFALLLGRAAGISWADQPAPP